MSGTAVPAGHDVDPTQPPGGFTLTRRQLMLVFAGLTAWWGPGGASLRRGSRSIVRGLSPGATASQVAAALLLVVAAALVATTMAADGPSWWPRTTAPGWVDEVVPTP